MKTVPDETPHCRPWDQLFKIEMLLAHVPRARECHMAFGQQRTLLSSILVVTNTHLVSRTAVECAAGSLACHSRHPRPREASS